MNDILPSPDMGLALINLPSTDRRSHMDPLRFEVRVVGERVTFGRKQFLVEPVCGRGQMWVGEGRVERLEGGMA